MKTIVCFAMMLVFVQPGFPQQEAYKSAFGVDAVIGIPTGDFADGTGTGYGLKPHFIYMVNNNVGFVTEIGYVSWAEKNQSSYFTNKLSSYFINTGIKLNLMPNRTGFYVTTTVGVHFLKSEYSVNFIWGEMVISSSGSIVTNKLNITADVGYELPLNDDVYLNVNGNYFLLYIDPQTIGYIGLNAGVRYTL